MSTAERETLLTTWAADQAQRHGYLSPAAVLQVVSGDASFRRYFRLATAGGSLVAVDAPPDREDAGPFVAIAAALGAVGLRVPRVLAADLRRGFMLLEDFGDAMVLPALTPQTADTLYGLAMHELLRMQQVSSVEGYALPDYDRLRLLNEMQLFADWFIKAHLALTFNAEEQGVLQAACEYIADQNALQPAVFVHRDYHARNLMLPPNGGLGIIDFQDAVRGPITYDLVSLLRDAYIAWPPQQVQAWVLQFAGLLRLENRLAVDDATFMRWFDMMGIQRHLKVVGIFARLFHRDGKAGYLADLPRVFNYLLEEMEGYAALAPLHTLLRERVLPVYLKKNPQATVLFSKMYALAAQSS